MQRRRRDSSFLIITMDANNPAPCQWERLFLEIRGDDELLHGIYTKPGAKIRVLNKWNEKAAILNGVEGATATKTGEQWKAAWASLKSRARKAYRLASTEILENGGAPPDPGELPINEIYREVIVLTGKEAALKINAGSKVNAACNMPYSNDVDYTELAYTTNCYDDILAATELQPPAPIERPGVSYHQMSGMVDYEIMPMTESVQIPLKWGPGMGATQGKFVSSLDGQVTSLGDIPVKCEPGMEPVTPSTQGKSDFDLSSLDDLVISLRDTPIKSEVERAADIYQAESNSDSWNDNVNTLGDIPVKCEPGMEPGTPLTQGKSDFDLSSLDDLVITLEDTPIKSEVERAADIYQAESNSDSCNAHVITLGDTPMFATRMKVLHTPPGPCGLTPSTKRRLEYKSPKSREAEAPSELILAIRENTAVMTELILAIRNTTTGKDGH